MADVGEFEYVKPPHFYIDKEAEEESLVPTPKPKINDNASTARFERSSNPLMDTNMNDFNTTDEGMDNVTEDLHIADTEEATPASISFLSASNEDPETEEEEDMEGDVHTDAATTEIEISIDDDSTSTQKIVVKETSKPTRGRTPKLQGREEEVAAKYGDGMTLKQLAEQYDVSVPCVSGAIKRTGAEIRSRGRQRKDS